MEGAFGEQEGAGELKGIVVLFLLAAVSCAQPTEAREREKSSPITCPLYWYPNTIIRM
jgi:hypothetical protein